MSTTTTVRVSILDNEYQVACPIEQKGELLRSAHYLDQQMRSIRKSGKVIGLDRIAVMAALNISHELLKTSERAELAETQGTAPSSGALDTDYARLQAKVDVALRQLRDGHTG
jgi:cell division protein ZapA